ncbi:mitogen-activated protein kinase kinase kinase 2 [Octopus bimaculoides]|uniref:Protein kinase domain-containing protein n=1 Tax=Octopus bimaculoides TaxID=37653 RepID=A0A0L8HR14_OCTBM|nr:mitogen-activated protein kinase kinase kinase 2 [Octopus bimaculoides]XP_052834449.1 mitogen-activated protein kinase kinase kinase 2 [Octopus bimaculoides]XP_052834450.1 mitogen-activated protein kinase kinase kinase 2 [Octopus bimaculoides]|eukprot:XP_014770127.1 PREDICTED: mitogen-activated protein kinase kinase kinase 2-like [Octopus bimaculoides]
MEAGDDFESVMGSIKTELERSLRLGNQKVIKAAYANIQKNGEFKIKFEYNSEKRAIQVSRSIPYEDLVHHVIQRYGMKLQMFYTQPNGEFYIPLECQNNLDTAIKLMDRSDRSSSLRIFLTKPADTSDYGSSYSDRSSSLRTSSSESYYNHRDSPSPPPGSLPPHEIHLRHSSSYNSITGEGQFIPEPMHQDEPISCMGLKHTYSPDGSIAGSTSSLDSNYISCHGESYPFRNSARRDSRRSILSDGNKEDMLPGSKMQAFGTFPRGYETGTHMADVERHRTFPRSNNRRPELCSRSVPALLTRGSEGTLSSTRSTSSSSSGLPPDPDLDSPEGRLLMKRNSDMDSPSFGFSDVHFSKSPRAPTNWKKGRLLGPGAFGEVYLCYDEDSGRELAVKQVQISADNAEVSKEVRALENEIQLLRNFHHERIVQYFGCIQGKVLSIFMEYMPGGSLRQQLQNYGPLNENLARKYTRQVLEGLAFLHKNVIVHRDIKCANILKNVQGNVKLGDFGASKRLQSICSMSGMKTVIGTPHWMAPEVINGEGYCRKADIWSLGCTVVEMFTMKPPWPDLESMAAIYKIATSEHPKYELPFHVSDIARDCIRNCFRKNSRERPTAEDLLRHRFIVEGL